MSHSYAETKKRSTTQRRVSFVALAFLVCSASFSTGVLSGQSDQSEKLRSKSEEARKALEKVKDQTTLTLDIYNSIVRGEAKRPDSTYKKLEQNLKQCQKMSEDAHKRVDSMQKEADRFFRSWEAELEEYFSEDLKEKSRVRLKALRARYQAMNDAFAEAGEIHRLFLASLQDQVLFLGRDLSPTAISNLRDDATALNVKAVELLAKIAEITDDAKEQTHLR